MRSARLVRSLFVSALTALALASCIVDEKRYDPSLVAPPSAQCETYCDAIQNNCSGRTQVYADKNDCLRICALLPSGDELEDPERTNTVACRLLSAQAALSERSSLCPAASPHGDNRCGTSCEAYCTLRLEICENVPEAGDVDVDACLAQCSSLNDDVPYLSNMNVTGDTLACRISHLVNASRSPEDALDQCWQTRVAPDIGRGTSCGDPQDAPGDCESLCELVMKSCQNEYAVYESEGQCLAVCRVFPLGFARDTGAAPEENTVACRRYHAYAALAEGPGFHCPHAGPPGDGHCGNRQSNSCESYCRVLKRGCSTRFFAEFLPEARVPGEWPDNPDIDELGSCVETCVDELAATGLGAAIDSRYGTALAPLIDASDDGDRSQGDVGDVFQCRLFHAVRALGGVSGSAPEPGACDAAFGEAACLP